MSKNNRQRNMFNEVTYNNALAQIICWLVFTAKIEISHKRIRGRHWNEWR